MISGKEFIRLLQEDSEKAWSAFLNDQTDYIFAIIRQYVYRRESEEQDTYQERIADTYLYILEKLSGNHYRRLNSFRGDSKLTTWLATVCRNLCIDYVRGIGEAPPEIPASIKRLPEAHQIAFKLFYLKRYEYSECFENLTVNHGFQLSYGEFLNVMGEINTTLTDHQRRKFVDWRNCMLESLDAATTHEENGRINHKESDDRTPEREVITNESIEVLERIKDALRTCLASLSTQERMLIQFTFWQGEKPRDIARLMNISAKRASNATRNAIEKLKKCLQQHGYRQEGIVETLVNLEIL